MSDKKNIDNLFRETFNDFEASPDPALWDKISDRLDAQESEKKRERIIFLPWLYKGAGIAAALLLLFFVGNELVNTNENGVDSEKQITSTTKKDADLNENKNETSPNSQLTNTNSEENSLNNTHNSSTDKLLKDKERFANENTVDNTNIQQKNGTNENAQQGNALQNAVAQQNGTNATTTSQEASNTTTNINSTKNRNLITNENAVVTNNSSQDKNSNITNKNKQTRNNRLNNGNYKVGNDVSGENAVAQQTKNGTENSANGVQNGVNSSTKNTNGIANSNTSTVAQNDKNKSTNAVANSNTSTVAQNDKNKSTNAVVNSNTSTVAQNDKNKSTNAVANSNTSSVAQNDKNKPTNATNTANSTTTDATKLTETTVAEVKKDDEIKKSLLDVINDLHDLEKDTEVAEAKRKKWTISPNASPVYYNSITNGSPIDEAFADNSKVGEVNLSYGINVGYDVSKRLTVRSGIHKVDYSYNTQDIALVPSINGNALSTIAFRNNGAAFEIKDRGAPSDILYSLYQLPTAESSIFEKQIEGKLNQRMSYIEVPVELKYAVLDKKLGVNVIGGVSTLLLTENSISVDSPELFAELGEATNINTVSFSTNIGLGIDYKISEKLEFNVEPMLKYQLNTFSGNTGNFKPYSVGVYTGVSFKF